MKKISNNWYGGIVFFILGFMNNIISTRIIKPLTIQRGR